MTTPRKPPVVRIETATAEGSVRPVVFIETTAKGELTYGVRVSGRSLAQARERAQAEFARLRAFAVEQAKAEGKGETT